MTKRSKLFTVVLTSALVGLACLTATTGEAKATATTDDVLSHVAAAAAAQLSTVKEDIPLLVQHFTQTYAEKLGKRIATVSERMMAALCGYA